MVVPLRDVAAADIKVAEFLSGLRADAGHHMCTALEFAASGNWDDAEIHTEISLDRIRMHNEVKLEMENYR